MLEKRWYFLICLLLLTALFAAGAAVYASGAAEGDGTWESPLIVTDAYQLSSALSASGNGTVYIRLGADIEGVGTNSFDRISVKGDKCLDLCGFTLRSKLFFYDNQEAYRLFVVEPDAALTLEDSVGGGEIIYDRYIPSMSEANAYTAVFLDRPLTVFEVKGELTVNGGAVTAGHYESEYYTYTDGFIYTDSSPSPGRVNSITPGSAIVVKNGGSFTANGGEYFGRGFIMDPDGGKEGGCAAVLLESGAQAFIYAGDFYGKSNADVFSVSSDAAIKVISGNFHARYDNRITADKLNGVAYYLNVDCGRIGIPLRAFDNDREEFTHILRGSVEYNWTPDFTQRDDEDFTAYGTDGTGADLTVTTLIGNGAADNPYLLKNASDIEGLMHQRKQSKVYIRLENDITDCVGNYFVTGNIVLDLNGHELSGKLNFNAYHPNYTLFTVNSGSALTINDWAGGGEIIFDRRVPNMGETNEQTDIILYRHMTVFAVNGTLTVNAGEITAGHYESEHYTFTLKYGASGVGSAGSVNSITPGCAVTVNDGGRFVSNGGEYYGRGFTIDDNGEKDFICAAVRLKNGAAAVINDGRFYGKSNADVFSVPWGASVRVYSGSFRAEYDNRITVDKTGGVARYVNVDCGRIGLPLHAFSHSRHDRLVIKVNGEDYPFSINYTSSQSDDFENLCKTGTGAAVTVAPKTGAVSCIEREDGLDAGLTYSPMDHFLLRHRDAEYFSSSFGAISGSIHNTLYYWKVTKRVDSSWTDVSFTEEAETVNGMLCTEDAKLDLFELARLIEGGMEHDVSYRITAFASELWRSCEDYDLSAESAESFELDCRYERIGKLSLPDSLTGICWPEHGAKPKNITLEQEEYIASLIFEELSKDGVHWAPMSERSGTFILGKSYRLKVKITPKAFYLAEAEDSVSVGGKTVESLSASGMGVIGCLPLEVSPARISSVSVAGVIAEGVKLTASTPLTSGTANVSIFAEWEKNGADFMGTALYGDYRARITLTALNSFVLTDQTTVKVFGKEYSLSSLSSDGKTGSIYTDVQTIACSHTAGENSFSFDAEEHRIICSVCGEELSKGAHSFGSWMPRGGVDVRTCSVCGYEETTPNGKAAVPFIRFTAAAPVVGDPLPIIAVCEADAKYASLEHEAEWYDGELNYKNRISADTVMEAGKVYCCFVKLNVNDGYYFTDDTEVVTLNNLASTTSNRHGSYRHLEAVLLFSPREYASAEFTLGQMTEGQTYEDFLSGFDAAVGGEHSSFTVSIFKNSSSEGSLVYTYATDSWWIVSGDLSEFLARQIVPDAEYRLLIGLYDAGRTFDASQVSVLNPEAVDSYEIAAGTAGCTLTVFYQKKPSAPPKADYDDNGVVDTEDVSELLVSILFDDAEADLNGDGKTDCLDALELMVNGSFTDSEKAPELFVAVAYDEQDRMIGLRFIDLSKDLADADLEFLTSAAAVGFYYLDGDVAPVAEGFKYSPAKKQEEV